MAAAAAEHELLRAVPAAPGAEQERVQPLLPRLHRRRPLRLLPPRAPRPPRRPDPAVLVPQRDPGVGGGEADRHLARADVRDQQRQDRVPQRPAAGQARQGRHQHLRDLLPEPPGLVPILLPRMQAGRDAVGPEPDVRHTAEARAGLRRRRLRLRRRLVQPQEAPADGRVRPQPLRAAGHPVVRRRGQQVQHHAGNAADQQMPAVQEEGHPPPRSVLWLAIVCKLQWNAMQRAHSHQSSFKINSIFRQHDAVCHSAGVNSESSDPKSATGSRSPYIAR